MGANNASNVTTGKPKVGGALFKGATNLTLPITADGDIAAGFSCLGYCSEDGLVNTMSLEGDNIKAWGGDVVLDVGTGETDQFKVTLIESMDTEVLKLVHGSANVSGNLEDGIAVSVNSNDRDHYAYVCDMVLKGNVLKRIVIPDGKVTEIGDITYKDDEAVGYEVTISAFPDANGNTHYEYIKAAGSGSDS